MPLCLIWNTTCILCTGNLRHKIGLGPYLLLHHVNTLFSCDLVPFPSWLHIQVIPSFNKLLGFVSVVSLSSNSMAIVTRFIRKFTFSLATFCLFLQLHIFLHQFFITLGDLGDNFKFDFNFSPQSFFVFIVFRTANYIIIIFNNIIFRDTFKVFIHVTHQGKSHLGQMSIFGLEWNYFGESW